MDKEPQIPKQRESMIQIQVDDFKNILYRRVEELHLNDIDLSRGRTTQGRYKFMIWDNDGHRIDFDICQLAGAKGWLEANRTEEPDPDIPESLSSHGDPIPASEKLVLDDLDNPGKQTMKPDWGFE